MLSWWEKEENYYRRWRAGSVVNDLWQYIPDKLSEAVTDAIVLSDGYWVYLGNGWTAYDGAEDCGMIHVYTIADLKADLKTVRKAVSA